MKAIFTFLVLFLVISFSPATAQLSVSCGIQTIYYSDTFGQSTPVPNWAPDNGVWQSGTPSFGPGAAHSGTKCWGTSLSSGIYPLQCSTRLINTSPITVPSAAQNPRLRFWHWYSFSTLSGSDVGKVQIKYASSSAWVNLTSYSYMATSSGVWSREEIDLTPYADSAIQLGFFMQDFYLGGANYQSSGWYIDDVEIVTGPYIHINPEGYENGWRDWSATGTWEIGTPSVVGPGSAYSGTKCAGTNLTGNYAPNCTGQLKSPWMKLPPASSIPSISFYHWFSFATLSGGDYGKLQFRTRYSGWKDTATYTNASSGWTPAFLNMSRYADSVVQFGFLIQDLYMGGANYESAGWYIDNVYINGLPDTTCFNPVCTPLPTQPGTITGSSTVCSSFTQTYSIAAVAGATSYTWTLPSGWTGTSTTNSISAMPNASGGNISVTANNACGSSAPRVLAVSSSSATGPAQPGPISGNTAVCPPSNQTYSISPVSGAASYIWTFPTGWTSTGSGVSVSATPGTSGGNITVTANNSCGSSAPQSLAVSSGPTPAQPGAISGNATACSGSSQTYSVTPVSGATFYIWTLPSGWTGSSATNSITTTPGVSGGVISVTASNGYCTSTAQSLTASVNAPPAQPGTISGSIAVCANSSQTYSIAAVTGATSYTWTPPPGWTSSSTANGITTTAGSLGGSITVTANNSCGSSTAQSLTVTVIAPPAQPGTISGGITVCSSSSQTYSVPAVTGATSYTWTLPPSWTGSNTTNSTTATVGASGNITLTANNSCGSSIVQNLAISVITTPAQPGIISGNITVCSGSSQTYSVAPVADATGYTWAFSSGNWTGSSTTNSITATAGISGNISVTANNSCGNSAPRLLAVSANTAPAQPGTISGNTAVCSGTIQTYSVAPVSGATSYTWTVPPSWTSSGSTLNSTTDTAGASGGTIRVVATNSCGSSAPQLLAVSSHATPAQPGPISGNVTVCSGTSQIYSVTAVSGATFYIWTLPGWSGSSASDSITTTSGTSGGNITVTASNGYCTSAVRSLTTSVNTVPAHPGSVSGNATICAGSTQTYTIAAVTGATSYTWTLPSGWSGTSTSNSVVATAGVSGGNITVTANNSCGTSAVSTFAVTILPAPVPVISINGYTLSTTISFASYQWYRNDSLIIGATSANYTATQKGSYHVVVNDAAGCSDKSNALQLTNVGVASLPNGAEDIHLYPNPTSGMVYIDAPWNVNITIRNAEGKKVSDLRNVKEINLDPLADGLYMITLSTLQGAWIKSEKIIKTTK